MRSYRYTAIETVVSGLEAVWEGARVLVWHVVAHEPKLIVTRRSRTSDMEAALRVWHTKWRQIEAARTVRQDNAVYHPVCTPTSEFLGFVQGVGGTCGTPETPEVQGYVESRLRVLAVALAGGAREEARDENQTEDASGSAVVTVLANADREETERAKTVAALARNNWNASAAARALGIKRQSVWRRMTRMAIPRPSPSPFDSRHRRKPPHKRG